MKFAVDYLKRSRAYPGSTGRNGSGLSCEDTTPDQAYMPVDYEFRRGPDAEGYPPHCRCTPGSVRPEREGTPLRHMSAPACVGPGGPEFDGYRVAGSSLAGAVRLRSSVGRAVSSAITCPPGWQRMERRQCLERMTLNRQEHCAFSRPETQPKCRSRLPRPMGLIWA